MPFKCISPLMCNYQMTSNASKLRHSSRRSRRPTLCVCIALLWFCSLPQLTLLIASRSLSSIQAMFLVTLCEELKNQAKPQQTRIQAGIYLKNSLDAKVCDCAMLKVLCLVTNFLACSFDRNFQRTPNVALPGSTTQDGVDPKLARPGSEHEATDQRRRKSLV